MTIVLSARRRMTASRHTALFVLVDLTSQMTMKTMIGIEDYLCANYDGRVARPAADCTQTCHFLRMHIARIFPSYRLPKLRAYLQGHMITRSLWQVYPGPWCGDICSRVGSEYQEQRPDPLTEPKQVIVAVSRGEGDVGFRAVIE